MRSSRKILEEKIPEGTIVVRKWLLDKTSLDVHSIDNLVKSEQLRVLKNGIYTRGNLKISWQSVVHVLQNMLNTDCLVGGLSALELKGFSHYIPQSKKTIIHLYGNDKLPAWINVISDDFSFVHHSRRGFFTSMDVKESENYSTNLTWKEGMKNIKISILERACLEMLNEVPAKISFEHADQLMQSMTSLSPRILQRLLEVCTNVKVKRLLLYFGKRHNYLWFIKLDQSKINIGSGNRMIIKEGILDKDYKITVPKYLDN